MKTMAKARQYVNDAKVWLKKFGYMHQNSILHSVQHLIHVRENGCAFSAAAAAASRWKPAIRQTTDYTQNDCGTAHMYSVCHVGRGMAWETVRYSYYVAFGVVLVFAVR